MIQPAKPGPAGVAAIVNGKKIYRFQVANQALNAAGPQILNTMILIELISQAAAKQHVVVTPAQVNAQLDQVRQAAAARVPGGLEGALAQRHETLASFKQQLLTQMQAEALVAKTLPPASSQLQYHARHLLIMTAPSGPMSAPGAKPPHTDAEALAIIAKAQAELKAGKSFVEVANEYTEDPSGKGKGGDLGIINADTPFDPAFLKAALALKPGEVTPTPVKSQYGYHLIKIDDTSAAPLPADAKLFADAAAAERKQQVQAAIPGYVQNLRKDAKIVDYLGQ
jgi:peptidyl-prolyl cis-trans isomerase C